MRKRFELRVRLLLAALIYVSLACQTSGLLPSFFVTATPIPTITRSPSPTPTATQLPTSMPSFDISLELQADGSTLFIDPKTGISLLIPAAWVGIPAGVDDLTPYIEQASENNPQFSKSLPMLQKMDPNTLRIMVVDSNIDHYTDSYVPNFTVMVMKDPFNGIMPLDSMLRRIRSSIKSQFPQANLLNSGIEQVSGDFSYGYNEWQIAINGRDGALIKAFQKQSFFLAQDYLVLITLSTHFRKYDDVLLEFNTIMKTVHRLEQ